MRGRAVRALLGALASALLAASPRPAAAGDVRWSSIQVREGAESDSVAAAGIVRGAKDLGGAVAIEFRCGAFSEVVPAEKVRVSGSAVSYRAPKGGAGIRSFSMSRRTGRFRLSVAGAEVGLLADAVPVVLDVGGRRASAFHEFGVAGAASVWRKGGRMRTDLRVRVFEVTHVQGNALITPAAQVRFTPPATDDSGAVRVVRSARDVGADGVLRATIDFTDASVLDALDLAAVIGAGKGLTGTGQARVTAGDDGESEALVFVERRNADVRTLSPGAATEVDFARGDGGPVGRIVVPAGAVAAPVPGFAFTPVTFGVALPAPLPPGMTAIAGAEVFAPEDVTFAPGRGATLELARPRGADRAALGGADLRLLVHRGGTWAEVAGRGLYDAEADRIVPDAADPAQVPGTGFAVWAAREGPGKARSPKRRLVRGRVLDRDGTPLRGQAVLTRSAAMVTSSDGSFVLDRAALGEDALEVVQAIGAVTSASRVVSGGDAAGEVEVLAATAAPNVFRFGKVSGRVFESGGLAPAAGARVTVRLASAVRGLLLDDGGTPADASDDVLEVPDLGDFGVTSFAWHVTLPGGDGEFTSAETGSRASPRDLVAEAQAAGRTVREGAATVRVSYTVPILGEVGLFAGFRVTLPDGAPGVSEIQLPAALESTAAQSVVAGPDGSFQMFLRAPAGIPMTALAESATTPEADTRIFPFSSAVTQDLAFPIEPEPPVPAGLVQDAWVPRASMLTARARGASVVLGGRIWVAGGVGADGRPLGSLEVYDPQADAWTARAPMGTPRDRCALAVAGGRIYAIGGRDETGTLASVECYDPVADEWTPRAPLPRPRDDAQAVALGTSIHVSGGRVVRDSGPEDDSPTVEVYDWTTDTWTVGPTTPGGRAGGDGAVIGGRIHVRGRGTPAIVSFDPETGVWTPADAQDPWFGGTLEAAVCTTRGELCIVGGHDSQPVAMLWDPGIDAFGHLPAPATARVRGMAESLHGIVWSFGGFVGGVPSATCEALRLTWVRRADMPTPRWHHAAAAWRGRAYVAGGSDGDASLDVLEVYDPERDFWFRKAPLPSPRQELTLTELGGILYAVGGRRIPGDETLTAVDAYDPVTDTWTPRAPIPRGRFHHVAGVIGDRIYVGSGGDDNLWSYDPAADAWTRHPGMRSARDTGAGAAVGGRLFIVSGEAQAFKTLVNERYDPATGRWTIQASIPKEREQHAAVEVDGELWLVQGRWSTWPWWAVRWTIVYDPESDSWRDGPHMTRAALAPAVVRVGDDVYLFGGRAEPGQFDHYPVRDQILRTTNVHRTR